MKALKIITVVAIAIISLTSCNELNSKQLSGADKFVSIEKQLKGKFGKRAYYTDLTISHNKSIGYIIDVKVSVKPESFKMEQWNFTQGIWRKTSEISIEIPKGSKATDLMYQLDDKVNLSKLGTLAQQSSNQLSAEKDIKEPELLMAFIKSPRNKYFSKTEYSIMLKPDKGRTTISYSYALNGDLISMNY